MRIFYIIYILITYANNLKNGPIIDFEEDGKTPKIIKYATNRWIWTISMAHTKNY